MINLSFDLETGVAKLDTTTALKMGSDAPVTVVFSAAPGTATGLKLAMGSDTTAPQVLAYTETFSQENATTWTALLDLSDTRLATFMTGKANAAVNLEFAAIIDGALEVSPNLPVNVQTRIISGPTTSESGPDYYSESQVDTLLAAKAALTVAAHYRIKDDGTFQLWNPTQSKWHALTLSGASGAETLSIGAGET